MLPPPARGSRGSYAARLWSGLFLHLLITAEVKPDPGKQARSAEINSPKQDKGTDLLTAGAAAFPQAQQQCPGPAPSHRERPLQQPGTPLARITAQKPQLGVLNQIYCPYHLSSESKELAVTACSSFSIMALLHCTARGMLYKQPFIFPSTHFYLHICSTNRL